MHECYSRDYFLRMINIDLSEIEVLSSPIAYRALTNDGNEDINTTMGLDGETNQFVPSVLSFAHGAHMAYMFYRQHDIFEKIDYTVDGLKEEFYEAIDDMNMTILKSQKEPISIEDFLDLQLKLYDIRNKLLFEMGDQDEETISDYIFAGVVAFFIMGANLNIYSMASAESEAKKSINELEIS
jgi:hypothetical protein